MCGNGVVETGEDCDDGNTTDGDGCNNNCKLSSGTPVWTQTLNGSNGLLDTWYAVTVDSAGNAIVAGARVVGQTTDAVVAKYDPTGKQLWLQTYDGGVNGDDAANSVAVDAQGNIIVAGSVTEAGVATDNKDMWIRKYDPSGNVLWTKAYYGYDSSSGPYDDLDDIAYGVAVNAAGDIFVATTITYDDTVGDVDILIGKLTGATGDIVWADSYYGPGDSDDEALSIAVDPTGQVIAAGITMTAAGDYDMWVRKYQDGGTTPTILWTQTYDDAAHQNDLAFGVATDASGNVVVVGEEPVNSQFDASIRKYDTNGNLLWTKLHAGAAGGADRIMSVRCDAAGNIYVGGSETTANATGDAWMAKYSPDGNTILWSDVYNGTGNDEDGVNGVAVDANGNAYAAGYTTTTSTIAWLRKYAP
jgi:uncharacterized delta-60 repeat protein